MTVDDAVRVPSQELIDMVAQSDAEFAEGGGLPISPDGLDSFFEALDRAND